MIEINLTSQELIKGLTCGKKDGLVAIDHYRRIIDFDEDYYIGLYYKDYDFDDDKKVLDEKALIKRTLENKNYWDNVNLANYDMTTKQRKEDLFFRIEKVQEEFVLKTGEDSTQIISGLVLYQDYPVGVIIPKKILDYKWLFNIEEEGTELSKDDIDNMFDGVKWWIDRLMEQGVYVGRLYVGNLLVSPNDYRNVALDKLDDLCTCRVETKEYVEKLAKRGNDLRKNAYKYLEEFRNYYHDYNKTNQHFI